MENGQKNIDTILCEAVEIVSTEEREAYLDRVCGDDNALRREAERLIADHFEAGDFLNRPAVVPGATVDQPITEKPGTQIGPYKLLQQIGEGGMGVVYMAEQKEPVKRRVALKIIKPGMDTRQVIARFEAERQALAMMDHPNIATVLDAGATESGRPYFVMELVNGISVTQFCDAQHLTPKKRLELFVPICQAVQHAHQKGIIHRDLKPSNVLVALYDGQAVPKVIDFGVAKATSQTLTEKTMFTQIGQIVGTLEYMSPEQAQRNQLDVDTRSDIYSLGVLLYELLTGDTPFKRSRLRSAAFDEMLRIIREEEPSKPSTKVSSSESLPSIAANRGIDANKLSTMIRGEIDWIVMKALEKDRVRRYETASNFADDVKRYLSDETVLACPPSAAYRFRKFVRRHKTALTVSSVITLAILLTVGGVGWMVRDRAAREQELVRGQLERQERMTAQIALILEEAELFSRQHEWRAALAVAKRAEPLLISGEAAPETQQDARLMLADCELVQRLDKARQRMAAWNVIHFDYAGAAKEYAAAFSEYGVTPPDKPSQATLARLREKLELAIAYTSGLDDWAGCLSQMRDRAGAKKLLELANSLDSQPWRSAVRAALLDAGPNELKGERLKKLAATAPVRELAPASYWQLASELRHRRHFREATDLLAEAQFANPNDYWINYDLAMLKFELGLFQEAIGFYRASLAIRSGDAASLTGLGDALRAIDRLDEAENCYRQAIESDGQFGPAWNNLGIALAAQDKLDDAVDCYNKVIQFAPEHPLAYANLGEALRKQHQLDDAIAAFHTSLKLDSQNARTHNNFGLALADSGRMQDAVSQLQTATKLDNSYAAAFNNLGAALKAIENFEEAAEAYRNAITIDPTLIAAHYNLGNILRAQGEIDDAVVSWKRAIKVDPDSTQSSCIGAYNNLGVFFAMKGNMDSAIDYWRKSIQLAPNNSQTRKNLANGLLIRAGTFAEQGAAPRAIDDCREVLKLTDSNPPLEGQRQEAQQLLLQLRDGEAGEDPQTGRQTGLPQASR